MTHAADVTLRGLPRGEMRLRKAWPRISDAGGTLVCFCCSCLCSSSARAALWSRLPNGRVGGRGGD
jgi:hypothetical protein